MGIHSQSAQEALREQAIGLLDRAVSVLESMLDADPMSRKLQKAWDSAGEALAALDEEGTL